MDGFKLESFRQFPRRTCPENEEKYFVFLPGPASATGYVECNITSTPRGFPDYFVAQRSCLGKSAKDTVTLKPLNHKAVIHYGRRILKNLFSITPRAWEPSI